MIYFFVTAKPKKRVEKDSSDDDISVDEESETEPAVKTPHPALAVKSNSRTKQPQRSGRKKTPPPPSSEESEEETNESRRQRPSRSVAKSAKRVVNMQQSESEEDIFQKPTRSRG